MRPQACYGLEELMNMTSICENFKRAMRLCLQILGFVQKRRLPEYQPSHHEVPVVHEAGRVLDFPLENTACGQSHHNIDK